MSTTVDADDLKKIIEQWDHVLREIPGAKRQLLAKLGAEMKEAVLRHLGTSQHVAGWQSTFPGSGGGYVAVRPMAKTKYKGYAVGYITNAVESGHITPSGTFVTGKGFYAAARSELGKDADEKVLRLMEQVADGLTGGDL